jgi:FkbM family methyltransferase
MLARISNALVNRFKQLTFRPYVIDRQICGDEIKFLIGDLFGAGWYGPKHDPWPELQWIKDHGIHPGDIVIDCGANHGFSSVLFSRWAGPTGIVYAIEPLAHNVDILRENLRLNNVANVIVHQVAAGQLNGPAMLTNHPNAAVTQDRSANTISVEMRRLDDVIDDRPVDFIKIDVEGYEIEVLKGAATRLLASRPRLALELHVCMYDDPLAALDQLFEIILPYNYSMVIQLEVDGPLCHFDMERHSPANLAGQEIVHLFCF